MPVKRCYICTDDPETSRLYGRAALSDGDNCPICYRPACGYHLSVVRWRWRENGKVSTTRICRQCKSTYAHRSWDVAKRDWIT